MADQSNPAYTVHTALYIPWYGQIPRKEMPVQWN